MFMFQPTNPQAFLRCCPALSIGILDGVVVAFGFTLAQHPSIAYSNEIYSRYMPRRRALLPKIESVLDVAKQTASEHRFHLFEVKYLPIRTWVFIRN